MDYTTQKVPVKSKRINAELNGTLMRFSPFRLFQDFQSREAINCLKLIGKYLSGKEDVALYGKGEFSDKLLEHNPNLSNHILGVFYPTLILPAGVKTIFLCDKSELACQRLKKNIPAGIEIITPAVIQDLDWKAIPGFAWVQDIKSIYPIDIPEIKFLPDQDLIVI